MAGAAAVYWAISVMALATLEALLTLFYGGAWAWQIWTLPLVLLASLTGLPFAVRWWRESELGGSRLALQPLLLLVLVFIVLAVTGLIVLHPGQVLSQQVLSPPQPSALPALPAPTTRSGG
jgi:hypothetical protein